MYDVHHLLSVQWYAWTEFKFTCVCVSVALSVNSPTGQTPQRIFTVDSLTDADLCKDVPCGGSQWWIIIFRGPKSPKTPILGGLNRHFKPNMQKIQIAISSDLCIRLTWNSTGSCGQQQRLRGWSRMVGKTIPRWRIAAILKIVISPYLSEKSSDFDDILYTAADFELDERHVKKSCIGQTPSSTERISCFTYIFGFLCNCVLKFLWIWFLFLVNWINLL